MGAHQMSDAERFGLRRLLKRKAACEVSSGTGLSDKVGIEGAVLVVLLREKNGRSPD